MAANMTIETEDRRFKVAEAAMDDYGRSFARIDAGMMAELGLRDGDHILLRGKRDSVFIARNAKAGDVGLDIVRIDGLGRKNIDASIGEYIQVEKPVIKDATKVTIAPAKEGVKIKASGEIFRKALMNKCVKEGDVVALKAATKTATALRDSSFFDSVIDDIQGGVFGAKDLTFVVVSVTPKGFVKITDSTVVTSKETAMPNSETKMLTTYDDIGGLDEEIKRVREMVELPLRHPEVFDRLGIKPPKGLLLHGPPGTGKTLLAKACASETGCHFELINGPEIMSAYYGGSEQNLRKIFERAQQNSPAIIFIDELDAIAPKRDDVGGSGTTEARVVAQLLTLMDGLKDRGKIVVIASTNRVNAIDPALRRPGRFDREIIIGVPNDVARLKILKIHSRNMPLVKVNVEELAATTYGFVGADLEHLCREAAMSVLREWMPKLNINDEMPIPDEILKQMVIEPRHFDDAKKVVRPSAMREVLIETPNVGWNDIGGMEDLKQRLREAVEWPLKNPGGFKRIGIRPPSGILLYGPPGVGKTMLGKAVAKECKANFILVKGPEIFSMWVGESERAIRKIFERARAVSPAIVFFDEIDSIAPMRSQAGSGGNGVADKVVNQLLTELDGVEDLHNVVVIASTNRPDRIDPALLRPGRFDRIIYTPSPDDDARKKILEVHLSKMKCNKDVNVKKLMERTPGFVGADIMLLCIEAGINALRDSPDAPDVKMKHFEQAFETVYPSLDPGLEESYKGFQKHFRKQRSKEFKDEMAKTTNYFG